MFHLHDLTEVRRQAPDPWYGTCVVSLVLVVLAAAPHQAQLSEALALEKSGRDGLALERLEALSVLDPTWETSRMELARLRLKLGADAERAGWHADIARSLSPENPRAHYLFALAEDEAGRAESAIRALEVALTLRAEFPDARLRLATILSAQRRWREAVAQWRLYLATAPTATGARLQLALALDRAGELKAAERELRALSKLDAVRVVATRRLIDLLEHSHRASEAAALRRSLEVPGRVLRPLKPSGR